MGNEGEKTHICIIVEVFLFVACVLVYHASGLSFTLQLEKSKTQTIGFLYEYYLIVPNQQS